MDLVGKPEVRKVKRPSISPAAMARSFPWRDYILSGGLVALATFIGLPLRPFINPTNLVMLYLIAVIVAAVWLGRYPAIFASLLSVIVFDVVFVPHLYKLTITEVEYLLTFAGLIIVGIVISTLVARVREQEMAARRGEAQAIALYELGQKLAGKEEPQAIAQTAVDHVSDTLGCTAAIFGGNLEGETPQLLALSSGFTLEPQGQNNIEWVLTHELPAGEYSYSFETGKDTYYPLQFSGQISGVLAIGFGVEDIALSGDQKRLLNSFAGQIAMAFNRARLTAQARQARLLDETEKLQSVLLSSISHDLRTPLATISGTLSSLLEDSALLSDTARDELVSTAWEEAIRLNRLVGNLLSMTRLESGAMKVVFQLNDAEELVGAALAQMPRRLQNRQVRGTVPRDIPPVFIDLALMVQALVNLVDNALKYSPLHEPVDISVTLQNDYVIIAVKDRGIGLVEEDIEHIFDKFYRSGMGSAGGIGLGLSIAKGIVEANHGRIWAENRPGGGAILSMALPSYDNDVLTADTDQMMT